MTLQLQKILDQGYELRIGRHIESLNGYWAEFVKSGEDLAGSWKDAGHGHSVESAIDCAIEMRRGRAVPSVLEFEC